MMRLQPLGAAVAIAAVLLPLVPAAAGTRAQAKRLFGVAPLVHVVSTFDGTRQPCWFWAPCEASVRPVPLVVCLHTWSRSYRAADNYRTVFEYARAHGWAFLGPHFRGPNKTPAACGGDAAVQDIVEAVAYAKKRVKIDSARVTIIGGSGGGHMALLMVGRHPDLWAGCAAFCPISDLARWHADSLLTHPGRGKGYARMMEAACGGTPADRPDEYRKRSPLTWLAAAKKAGVPVSVATGIHDGWTGSVPVGHAIRAFNALADEKAVLGEDVIRIIEETRAVPAALAGETTCDPFYSGGKGVYFQRMSRNVRLTLFDGGHDINYPAGLDFLSRQKKGRPADFSLPEKGRGEKSRLSK
jgi:pimeloyl-ACP methyl ester carboxylesterase